MISLKDYAFEKLFEAYNIKATNEQLHNFLLQRIVSTNKSNIPNVESFSSFVLKFAVSFHTDTADISIEQACFSALRRIRSRPGMPFYSVQQSSAGRSSQSP